MKKRIISGVGIIAATLALVWFGGAVTCIGYGIISLIAFYELAKCTGIVEKNENGKRLNSLTVLGLMCVVLLYLLLYFFNWSVVGIALVLLFIFMLICYVVQFPKYNITKLMNVVFAFFYGPFLLSYIYLTRQSDNGTTYAGKTIGFYMCWMIFISPWLSDTMAFFIGSFFGKHKAFPKLSPKKSIEGCIGGLLGGIVGGIAYYILLALLNIEVTEFMTLPFLCIIGFLGSLFGQLGDLVASAIKRNYAIKDYGNLIPGHGGIMDRFDSLLLISPIICFLCQYLG